MTKKAASTSASAEGSRMYDLKHSANDVFMWHFHQIRCFYQGDAIFLDSLKATGTDESAQNDSVLSCLPRRRVPPRREQYRPLSKSLELLFQVNANWSLKFWGVILPFVAVAVTVKFAFLANIISVSVEPSELAVNWRGGWLSALTVYCGTAASHCAWVWKWKSDRKIKTEKEIKRQGVGGGIN